MWGMRIASVLLGFVIGFQVSGEEFFGSLGEKTGVPSVIGSCVPG